VFETLTASTPRSDRIGPSSILSAAIHAGLLVLAALATRAAVATPAAPSRVHVDHFAVAPRQIATPQPPRSRTSAIATAPRLPTVAVPSVTPVGIPLIPDVATSPDQLQRLLGSADHDGFTPTGAPLYAPPQGVPLEAVEVDIPVQWLSGPTPVYPSALRSAGVEGSVTLRMVVDTSGRVSEQSLRVLHSTHEEFTAPAIAALLKARFEPARLRGARVAQLVQQTVRFRIQ
jgi:protein TonB